MNSCARSSACARFLEKGRAQSSFIPLLFDARETKRESRPDSNSILAPSNLDFSFLKKRESSVLNKISFISRLCFFSNWLVRFENSDLYAAVCETRKIFTFEKGEKERENIAAQRSQKLRALSRFWIHARIFHDLAITSKGAVGSNWFRLEEAPSS